MQLADKTVLITGAATGIGRATAITAASQGASLLLADLNIDELERTATDIRARGAKCTTYVTDVSNEDAVTALAATVLAEQAPPNAIVCSAGIQRVGRIETIDVHDWDTTMGVNARSCFLIAKHFVPAMRSAGNGGSIVNIASLAGVSGGPGMTAYSASKGAIIAFSKALANEVAEAGIRVNSVCPGWIDTPFNQPAIDDMGGANAQAALIARIVPLGRQGTPGEVADLILFLCSDASAYITGQSLIIDGGVR